MATEAVHRSNARAALDVLSANMASVSASPSGSSLARVTTSPLPEAGQLPRNFLDHLLLITEALVNSQPPSRPATNGTSADDHHSTSAIHEDAENDRNIVPSNATASAEGSASSSVVTLPLPRFKFEGGDERTEEIESNISKLVERLWRAEDQLAAINTQQQSKQQHDKPKSPSSPDASTSDGSGRRSSFANFPYPLSHAHPQSSTYPLSYPLGMGRDGPVLLTSGDPSADPESAVGAFERYSDESGLSAQEELRLLKAQVQDIARVCKVRTAA